MAAPKRRIKLLGRLLDAALPKPLQKIILFRRGIIELANQALGRVNRQVAIGGECDGQQLLAILDPAGAHDAIAIR